MPHAYIAPAVQCYQLFPGWHISPVKAQCWQSVAALGLFIILVSFHLQQPTLLSDLQSPVASCSPSHCSPPAAASPPMLIPTWPSGSEPDPEALCFLGLGSPSSCWNLWVVSHVSAELNLCLSQEDLGHMCLPRFSSQTIIAAWKGADGLTATDPVSLYASHTQAGGTQLNPLPPSSPLAGFIFSLSPKFVMVHMHYFSWLSFCEVRLPVTYMWRQCSSQLKKKEVIHWGLHSTLLLQKAFPS